MPHIMMIESQSIQDGIMAVPPFSSSICGSSNDVTKLLTFNWVRFSFFFMLLFSSIFLSLQMRVDYMTFADDIQRLTDNTNNKPIFERITIKLSIDLSQGEGGILLYGADGLVGHCDHGEDERG